ncbi:uncharacterized protein LOC142353226 [Convolutriloba macropyga]|uniref:uncharacterized protein LOC142353226 n=1 Tax=Convolutriloba macropyga TaxID=536237 RepID=UPI003F524079
MGKVMKIVLWSFVVSQLEVFVSGGGRTKLTCPNLYKDVMLNDGTKDNCFRLVPEKTNCIADAIKECAKSNKGQLIALGKNSMDQVWDNLVRDLVTPKERVWAGFAQIDNFAKIGGKKTKLTKYANEKGFRYLKLFTSLMDSGLLYTDYNNSMESCIYLQQYSDKESQSEKAKAYDTPCYVKGEGYYPLCQARKSK